jgi:hypothetical protein
VSKQQLNKFDQLLLDLLDGTLTITQIQIAIRAYVRGRKDVPEGIKDLLCGVEATGGLIGKNFAVLRELIGTTELAYRRGVAESNERRDALEYTLSQIMGALPSNKDWLDPQLEKLANDLVKRIEIEKLSDDAIQKVEKWK